MADLFMDGFDWINSNLGIVTQRGWTYGGGLWSDTGRFSPSLAIKTNGLFTAPVFAAAQTFGLAFAYRQDYGIWGAHTIVGFYDNGSNQCDVRVLGSGQVQLTRNGNVLATSAAALPAPDLWMHLEVKVTVASGTGGSMELRLNGVSFVSATNVNTQNTGSPSANQFFFGGSSAFPRYDDVILWNTSGSVNNNWHGDRKVLTRLPNGAGALAQWTPSAGANWQCVDEVTPNNDTDYVASSNAGDIDLYAHSGGLAGTIHSAQVVAMARKDDAGLRQIRDIVRSGGTNYQGGLVHTLGSGFQSFAEIWEADPNTAAPWTAANLNAAQFGVKLEA